MYEDAHLESDYEDRYYYDNNELYGDPDDYYEGDDPGWDEPEYEEDAYHEDTENLSYFYDK